MLLSALPGIAEYYEFTDAQGRSIMAKPVRVVGDKVEIQREDGNKYIVDPAIFGTKGQAYLTKWMQDQLMSSGNVLKISAKSATTRKQKDGSSRGVEIKRFKGYYKIKVTNESDLDLKNLQMQYRYFLFKNQVAADKRSAGKTMRVAGEIKIPSLRGHSDLDFETAQSDMMETELKSGYYWLGGGKARSEDELEGIWVRIYQGDKMIAEFANPSTLPKKEKWTLTAKK